MEAEAEAETAGTQRKQWTQYEDEMVRPKGPRNPRLSEKKTDRATSTLSR